MSDTDALALHDVRKSYGATRALDGLSFRIPRGSITGLVGPNGAGKTTCFGVVGGTVLPDSGRIDVLGAGPFQARLHQGRIGLLPQDAQLASHAAIEDLLAHYARLAGSSGAPALAEAQRVLDLVGLGDRRRMRVRELSHGMKRRVSVAQALLCKPELILLDEPTSGLDPHLVAAMRDLFRSLRGVTTLVLSSHVLSDLEAVCDHVIFMEKGRCIRQGSLAEVTSQGSTLRVRLARPWDPSVVRETLAPVTVTPTPDGLLVAAPGTLEPEHLVAKVVPALLQAGAPIVEVRSGESLEDRYLRLRGPG